MYNTANRKDIRSAEKAAKLTETQSAEVVARLMSTLAGRAWVLRLLDSCHVFHSSFTGNALTSAFAEGERNIGTQLLGEVMRACPDQYVQMMREQSERDAANDRRYQDRNGRDQGSESEFSSDPDFDGSSWVGEGPDPREAGH